MLRRSDPEEEKTHTKSCQEGIDENGYIQGRRVFINAPFLYSLLLYADILSISHVKDNNNRVVGACDKAIVMSSRSGFPLFAAIGNERSALYLNGTDDVDASSPYMKRCFSLLNEWDAQNRVDFLIKKYNLGEDGSKTFDNLLRGTYLTERAKIESAAPKHKRSSWMYSSKEW